MREVIAAAGAPKAIGPYSQAVKAGSFIFVSGQIALDPDTSRIIDGDVRSQTTRVLANISAILASAGTDISKVVKTTVFLTDMDDFSAMNESYAAFWKKDPPARSTVEVSRLPRDVRVEIEVVALAGS
jgi:2-iminobutanoate/2-iminopropanoate deaminase